MVLDSNSYTRKSFLKLGIDIKAVTFDIGEINVLALYIILIVIHARTTVLLNICLAVQTNDVHRHVSTCNSNHIIVLDENNA